MSAPVRTTPRGGVAPSLAPVAKRSDMSTADLAQPSRKALAARSRSGRNRVSGKLREACMLMAEGMSYAEAAKAVGMTTRGMRMALERAPVIAFLRAQRLVLRASMSGQNLAALARVRDQQSNPMATVRAVQAIETLDSDQGPLGSHQPVPGLTIVIQAAPPSGPRPAPVLDVTPTPEDEQRELEPVPSKWPPRR